MNGGLDRESLRARFRVWSDHERRIALERIVEQLPDESLERLLEGLVHLDDHRDTDGAPELTLGDRIDAQVAATQRGEYLGEYITRNAHGQRESWQTAAWLAATAHLFDLALDRARLDASDANLASLRALTTLIAEVDERIDELVVFEDSSASDYFWHDLEQAAQSFRERAVES